MWVRVPSPAPSLKKVRSMDILTENEKRIRMVGVNDLANLWIYGTTNQQEKVIDDSISNKLKKWMEEADKVLAVGVGTQGGFINLSAPD